MDHNLMVFIGSLMNIFVLDRRVFFDKQRTAFPLFALSFLFYVVLINVSSVLPGPRVSLVIWFASYVVISLNYEGSWKKRIVAAIALLAMGSIIDIGVMLLFGIYFDSFFGGHIVHNALTMTVTALVTFITALALQRLKHLKKDVISSPWILAFLFVIPLSSIVLVFFLAVTTDPTPFGGILTSAIIFGINVIVFYLHDKLAASHAARMEAALAAQEKEDKTMLHLVGLKATILLMVFALVAAGCATGNNRATDREFGFSAEAVSEGILLTFSNIPPDSARLFISVQSWDDTGEFGYYNSIHSFADIRDASYPYGAISSLQLERVRETGRVIFPIVQAGQKYTVSASAQTGSDINNGIEPVFVYAEVIAENGIHFDRDGLRFDLNDTNSAVTLHSVPRFSSDVVFHAQKIDFSVVISVMDTGSISTGTHHIPAGLSYNGLAWTFEPQMTDGLRKDNNGWLQSGSYYPAWAVTYANIVHDDIMWTVEIAKTPIFDFSL